MFWKRFYFVAILLSCNCFLLCSNWFCKRVKEIFCCGQTETTNDSDKGKAGNQGANNFLPNDNNNINNYNNFNILDNNKNPVKKVENNNINNNKSPVKEVENNNINNNNNPVNGGEKNNSNKSSVKEVESNNINNNKNLLNDNNIFANNTINDYENSNIKKDENVIDLSSGLSGDIKPKEVISPLKCVFLSATDHKVGKTSISSFFSDKKNKGALCWDFFTVYYKEKTTSKEMNIQLCDFSAQGKYKKLIFEGSHLAGTKAIIFVYDITNAESFNSLKEYIKEVRGKVPFGCKLFLLGNKLDLIEQNQEKRQVKTEDAKNFADEEILIFLGECSAKKNTYMPADRILYCTEKGLLEKDGKCTEGLHGMLKNIIWRVHHLV